MIKKISFGQICFGIALASMATLFCMSHTTLAQEDSPDAGGDTITNIDTTNAEGGGIPLIIEDDEDTTITGPVPNPGIILSDPTEATNSGNIIVAPTPPATPPATGWKGLVPCDGSAAKPCDWNALMTLIDTVIKFILYALSIPIAAIMFAYAGFLMVTSGGNTENRGKAKSIFSSVVFGLVFVAGAYLIVKTVLSILGFNGTWIGF